METQSQKRAEASSAALSNSSSPSGPTTRSHKRVCLSSFSVTAATTATTTTRSYITRAITIALMDPTTIESSFSSRCDRRSSKANKTTTSDNLDLASDKGKKKEHDLRLRDRDKDNRDNNNNSNLLERNLGLNMDTSGGDEDDNDIK